MAGTKEWIDMTHKPKIIYRNNKQKMCKQKVSFTNMKAALKVAEKHKQNVYECPICFCFHCTSHQNWMDDFVPKERFNNILEQNRVLQRQSGKKTEIFKRYRRYINELNVAIARLKKENKALKNKT